LISVNQPPTIDEKVLQRLLKYFLFFKKSFDACLENLIITRLGIFVVLGNPGSKVAWRCWGLYPNPKIPDQIPMMVMASDCGLGGWGSIPSRGKSLTPRICLKIII